MKLLAILTVSFTLLVGGFYAVTERLVEEMRKTRETVERLEREVRRAADSLNGMGGSYLPPAPDSSKGSNP